jgi:hypothetical protein
MTAPILRAPPLKQRLTKLAMWIGAGVAFVAATEYWLFPWLRVWLSVKDEAELLFRLRVVFGGLALGILAAAMYALHTGMRVLRAGQWPLPGAFVLRDTPVVTGRSVQWRGWGMIVWAAFAAALAVFAALMPALMHAG